MRSHHFYLLAVVTFASLGCPTSGCTTPTVDERTAEPFVVTRYDTTIDFGGFSTFAIAPMVSLVSDVIDAGFLPLMGGDMIIASVTSHLEERGYTQVEPTARPDLGVVVTALVRLKVETNVFPGYWWGQPGYVAPPTFFGFSDGFYNAGWGYSSMAFKSGTLIIDMFDLRDPGRAPLLDGGAPRDAGGVALESVWVGIGHGSVTLRASFAPTVLAVIDQAFAQSPYLQAQ
jgi:hypothetical protein